jgi:hypothetical protein
MPRVMRYLFGLWLLLTAALLDKQGVFIVSIPVAITAIIVLGNQLKEDLGL